MTQWILKQNGQIVPRRTMRRLTAEEMTRDSEVLKRKNFNEAIKLKFGDSFSLPDKRKSMKNPEEDNEECFDLPFYEIAPAIPEADVIDQQGKHLNE